MLKQRKFERIKDYLMMERDYVESQNKFRTPDQQEEEEKKLIELIRGTPVNIGTLEEIIDDENAIISIQGSEYYVKILSIVNKDMLELGCSVLLRYESFLLIRQPHSGRFG